MLYDPYFAVWPGLSALTSPPSCSDLPDFFMSDSRLHCWLSQTSNMAGCKTFFWCLKNVRSLVAAHFIVLKIHNATVGNAPDNYYSWRKKYVAHRNAFYKRLIIPFTMIKTLHAWLLNGKKCSIYRLTMRCSCITNGTCRKQRHQRAFIYNETIFIIMCNCISISKVDHMMKLVSICKCNIPVCDNFHQWIVVT